MFVVVRNSAQSHPELNMQSQDEATVAKLAAAFAPNASRASMQEAVEEIVRQLGPSFAKPAELFVHGVTVLPILNAAEAASARKDLLDLDLNGPEFLPGAKYPVLGGFAARGTPTSFHHPKVRELRGKIYLLLRPLLKQLACLDGDENPHTAMMFDRYMIRHPGQSPSAESWHRDVNPTWRDVFGGWTNLDPTASQFFACMPGTHLAECGGNSGFVTEARQANEVRIEVPPGHAIVFYQRLLHRVYAIPTKTTMVRIFHGIHYESSPGSSPLFDVSEVIRKQGVPFLPSGQAPPLASKNHFSAFLGLGDPPKRFKLPDGTKTTTIEWSEATFKPVCLESRVRGTDGVEYNVVKRVMESLADLGLPLFPEYSGAELQMFSLLPLK